MEHGPNLSSTGCDAIARGNNIPTAMADLHEIRGVMHETQMFLGKIEEHLNGPEPNAEVDCDKAPASGLLEQMCEQTQAMTYQSRNILERVARLSSQLGVSG